MHLLKEALKPNLAQTLEERPRLYTRPVRQHSARLQQPACHLDAMATSDYTVTEAGFGAELGGEKFIDIKCRLGNIAPSCAVLVTTMRSINTTQAFPTRN